jgi:hypothetical protein
MYLAPEKPRHQTTFLVSFQRPPDVTSTDIRPAQSTNTYPPTLSSHSLHGSDCRDPFDTPPVSPRAASYTTYSSGDSRASHAALIPRVPNAEPRETAATAVPPSPWSTSFASSSGHSRRYPSLGGDDSVADLKRRQQLAPAYDDSLSITSSSYAVSNASSSVRPLPVIPPDTSARSVMSIGDEPPPVYTLQ